MSKRKTVKMLNYANFASIKREAHPCSPLLQEQEAQEEISLEELLQVAKDLERAFLAAPCLESYIAQIKQLIDQIEKELEAYFNG